MTEKPDAGSENFALHPQGAAVSTHDLKAWFIREVLPLEAPLTQFLGRHWPYVQDVDDICQDVFVRVYVAAQKKIPSPARPFVFTVARNLLINRFNRNRIAPIKGVPDVAALEVAADEPGPDRTTIARDELRLLRDAFNRLPPRAREVLFLKRIENLSRQDIARRLGISENTVRQHLVDATRKLADMLHGQEGVHHD
jgi:RNA polymerase sigma-70 factor (ECF subfamily)